MISGNKFRRNFWAVFSVMGMIVWIDRLYEAVTHQGDWSSAICASIILFMTVKFFLENRKRVIEEGHRKEENADVR